MNAPARPSEGGFTLIEALATLLLTGLMLSAITTLTGQWLGGWNRGAARLERSEGLAVAFDRIARDVGGAIPMASPIRPGAVTFVGEPASLIFVHQSIDPGAPAGLEVVRLFAGRDGRLMRERGVYDPETPLEGIAVREAVGVTRESYGIAFSYLDDLGAWSPDWNSPKPPAALRVRLRPLAGGRDVIASFPVRAGAPALCARATTFRICEQMMAGQQIDPAQQQQQPQQPGQGATDDAEAARQVRARAGVAQ